MWDKIIFLRSLCGNNSFSCIKIYAFSIIKNTYLKSDPMNGMSKGELLIYQIEDGKTKNDVFFEDDTIWLNQKQMSVIYKKDTRTTNEHIKNIFTDGELR